MVQPPEVLSRHILEQKLRRSRGLNVALAILAATGFIFGGFQLTNATPVQDGSGEAAVEAGDAVGGSPERAVTDSADGGGAESATAVSIERRVEGDPMAIGAVDAPVVLSEWLDFRCPFCAVYARDTFPELVSEYVEAGKVRIEVHDVAFFGDESARAAIAARAAGEQGKYFEFMQALYAAAPESGHPELPPAQLREFAVAAGVPDLGKFDADTQRQDLAAAVVHSTAQAQQLGVTGVPFFAVDGQAFSGAQPFETFQSFLDQQLAAS